MKDPENTIKKIIDTLFRKASVTAEDFVQLRFQYDDELVQQVRAMYAAKYQMIAKRAAKLALLVQEKFKDRNIPYHELIEKAKIFKDKYNLSNDEFSTFQRLYEAQFSDDHKRRLELPSNTNMMKLIGSTQMDTYVSPFKLDDLNMKYLQEIIKSYSMHKQLHTNVFLQSILYTGCEGQVREARYSKDTNCSIFDHIHPIIVALFAPKLEAMDEYFLHCNLAEVITNRYNNEPITNSANKALIHNLSSDINDIVCNNKAPLLDLLIRTNIQHHIWNCVLNLRQGKFYNKTSGDFLQTLSNCKLNKYDNPDLTYGKNDLTLMKRLFNSFAFKPTLVITHKLTDVVHYNPYFRAFQPHMFRIPMINIRPGIHTSDAEKDLDISDLRALGLGTLKPSGNGKLRFFDLEKCLEKNDKITYSNIEFGVNTRVIQSNLLVFYIDRRQVSIDMSNDIYNNLSSTRIPSPIYSNFYELDDNIIAYSPPEISCSNDKYRLASVVCSEILDSKLIKNKDNVKKYIIGSSAYISCYNDTGICSYYKYHPLTVKTEGDPVMSITHDSAGAPACYGNNLYSFTNSGPHPPQTGAGPPEVFDHAKYITSGSKDYIMTGTRLNDVNFEVMKANIDIALHYARGVSDLASRRATVLDIKLKWGLIMVHIASVDNTLGKLNKLFAPISPARIPSLDDIKTEYKQLYTIASSNTGAPPLRNYNINYAVHGDAPQQETFNNFMYRHIDFIKEIISEGLPLVDPVVGPLKTRIDQYFTDSGLVDTGSLATLLFPESMDEVMCVAKTIDGFKLMADAISTILRGPECNNWDKTAFEILLNDIKTCYDDFHKHGKYEYGTAIYTGLFEAQQKLQNSINKVFTELAPMLYHTNHDKVIYTSYFCQTICDYIIPNIPRFEEYNDMLGDGLDQILVGALFTGNKADAGIQGIPTLPGAIPPRILDAREMTAILRAPYRKLPFDTGFPKMILMSGGGVPQFRKGFMIDSLSDRNIYPKFSGGTDKINPSLRQNLRTMPYSYGPNTPYARTQLGGGPIDSTNQLTWYQDLVMTHPELSLIVHRPYFIGDNAEAKVARLTTLAEQLTAFVPPGVPDHEHLMRDAYCYNILDGLNKIVTAMRSPYSVMSGDLIRHQVLAIIQNKLPRILEIMYNLYIGNPDECIVNARRLYGGSFPAEYVDFLRHMHRIDVDAMYIDPSSGTPSPGPPATAPSHGAVPNPVLALSYREIIRKGSIFIYERLSKAA